MNLQKRIALSIAIASLVGLTAAGASAATLSKGTFTLPVQAYWGDKLLPAGDYRMTLNRELSGVSLVFVEGEGTAATAIEGVVSGRIPWGDAHHDGYRRLHRRSTGLGAILEDLPEAHNRVTLDPVLKDGNGIPAPKIDYTLSENSRRMMDFAIARGTDILKAAGAYDVEGGLLDHGGWHLMGTARMGNDPETSVVNAWGRSHDVRNLFIVDGSIFITSAGVNPTHTIQALALYIADQIKQRLGTLFD